MLRRRIGGGAVVSTGSTQGFRQAQPEGFDPDKFRTARTQPPTISATKSGGPRWTAAFLVAQACALYAATSSADKRPRSETL